MPNELQRHERYKQYALKAYNIETAKFPKDVKLLGIAPNPKTGFLGYVLKENDRIVIVFKGTDYKFYRDLIIDVKSDVNMAFLKKIPEQTTDALELYDRVKKRYPKTPIDLTGHSLGGSLAQYVAVHRKVNNAICFAPVGIGKSIKQSLIKYGDSAIKTPESRIINYNNPNDIWTKLYRNQLVGTNYTIDSIDFYVRGNFHHYGGSPLHLHIFSLYRRHYCP